MKKIITAFTALALVAGISACSQAKPEGTAPEVVAQTNTKDKKPAGEYRIADMQVTHVDAKKAQALMQSRPEMIVLDVRTPSEYAAGHIEGAINIDFKNSNFGNELIKLDKSKDYIIHCRSGGRSTRSLAVFKKTGFSKITHMDGGMIAWDKAGLPTVK